MKCKECGKIKLPDNVMMPHVDYCGGHLASMRPVTKKDVKYVDTCYDNPLKDNPIIEAITPVVEVSVLCGALKGLKTSKDKEGESILVWARLYDKVQQKDEIFKWINQHFVSKEDVDVWLEKLNDGS